MVKFGYKLQFLYLSPSKSVARMKYIQWYKIILKKVEQF